MHPHLFSTSDHERFSKLWAGIQSMVLACAVLAGGTWTVYTFLSLDLTGKARAELKKIETENHLLEGTPVINVAINTIQERSASGGYNLAILVKVENKGTRKTLLKWVKATPLTVALMTEDREHGFVPAQLMVAKPVAFSEGSPAPYEVAPGNTQGIPFLVHVPVPGLYYIKFQAEASIHDPSNDDQLPISAGRPPVWADSAFVVVHP